MEIRPDLSFVLSMDDELTLIRRGVRRNNLQNAVNALQVVDACLTALQWNVESYSRVYRVFLRHQLRMRREAVALLLEQMDDLRSFLDSMAPETD